MGWWGPGAASGVAGIAADGGGPAEASGVYSGVVGVADEGEVVHIGSPTVGVGADVVDLALVCRDDATRRGAAAVGGDEREALIR